MVSVHYVLGEGTRGLIGAPELRAMDRRHGSMKPHEGRSSTRRPWSAPCEEGWIAGAGLDVFDTEPLPPDHPLRRAPNTVLTPHLGYVTEETYRIFYAEALEDVQAFIAGRPIRVIEA